MPNGVDAIAAERWRQVFEEGWSHDHDDKHIRGELARAACCYAIPPRFRFDHFRLFWPATWDDKWFKPAPNPADDLEARRRDLVKAGALIAAEIDRINRALIRRAEQNPGGANLETKE